MFVCITKFEMNLSSKAKAIIRMLFLDKTQLDIIFKALEPEAKKPATVRAHVVLRREGLFLVLDVEARDIVALRATLNTYLRWINAMLETITVCSSL